MPGHPAATSARVSTGNKQRWVSIRRGKLNCLCWKWQKSPFFILSITCGASESNSVCVLCREKKELKHWCATCHTHFTSSITEHRRTEEHKVISCSLWRNTLMFEKIFGLKLTFWCSSNIPQLASRTVISSCTVCKKHFRTSQIFVEHLQSLEHRQKVEKVHVSKVRPDLNFIYKNQHPANIGDPSLFGSQGWIEILPYLCLLLFTSSRKMKAWVSQLPWKLMDFL